MFYEIIYETGAHSVAEYADDAEAIDAVRSHHSRATSGERATESNEDSGPAERIVAVLKYNDHPATYGESQAFNSSDVTAIVNSAVEQLAVGDMVSVAEVAAAVKDISSPVVSSEPHESNYKMAEVGQLDSSEWVD